MPVPKQQAMVGPAGFFQWLQSWHPQLFAKVKQRAPQLFTQAGLGRLNYQPSLGWAYHMGALGQDDGSMQEVTVSAPAVAADNLTTIDTTALAAPVIDVTSMDSGVSVPTISIPAAVASSAPTADPNQPGSAPGGWASTMANLATSLVQGVENVKLFNTQLSLAQQGKPLLNTSQLTLPAMRAQIGVAGTTLGPVLVVGGVLGLLWILLGRRRS